MLDPNRSGFACRHLKLKGRVQSHLLKVRLEYARGILDKAQLEILESYLADQRDDLQCLESWIATAPLLEIENVLAEREEQLPADFTFFYTQPLELPDDGKRSLTAQSSNLIPFPTPQTARIPNGSGSPPDQKKRAAAVLKDPKESVQNKILLALWILEQSSTETFFQSRAVNRLLKQCEHGKDRKWNLRLLLMRLASRKPSPIEVSHSKTGNSKKPEQYEYRLSDSGRIEVSLLLEKADVAA